jgi:hypothetical protein
MLKRTEVSASYIGTALKGSWRTKADKEGDIKGVSGSWVDKLNLNTVI